MSKNNKELDLSAEEPEMQLDGEDELSLHNDEKNHVNDAEPEEAVLPEVKVVGGNTVVTKDDLEVTFHEDKGVFNTEKEVEKLEEINDSTDPLVTFDSLNAPIPEDVKVELNVVSEPNDNKPGGNYFMDKLNSRRVAEEVVDEPGTVSGVESVPQEQPVEQEPVKEVHPLEGKPGVFKDSKGRYINVRGKVIG